MKIGINFAGGELSQDQISRLVKKHPKAHYILRDIPSFLAVLNFVTWSKDALFNISDLELKDINMLKPVEIDELRRAGLKRLTFTPKINNYEQVINSLALLAKTCEIKNYIRISFRDTAIIKHILEDVHKYVYRPTGIIIDGLNSTQSVNILANNINAKLTNIVGNIAYLSVSKIGCTDIKLKAEILNKRDVSIVIYRKHTYVNTHTKNFKSLDGFLNH